MMCLLGMRRSILQVLLREDLEQCSKTSLFFGCHSHIGQFLRIFQKEELRIYQKNTKELPFFWGDEILPSKKRGIIIKPLMRIPTVDGSEIRHCTT